MTMSRLNCSLLGRIVRWLLSRTSPGVRETARRSLHRRHLLVTVHHDLLDFGSLAYHFLLLRRLLKMLLLLHIIVLQNHDIRLLNISMNLVFIRLQNALKRLMIFMQINDTIRILMTLIRSNQFLTSEFLMRVGILGLETAGTLGRGNGIVFLGGSGACTIQTISFTLDCCSFIVGILAG